MRNLALLLLLTLWGVPARADEEGTVSFRRDIYKRDARLARALSRPPPRPPAQAGKAR